MEKSKQDQVKTSYPAGPYGGQVCKRVTGVTGSQRLNIKMLHLVDLFGCQPKFILHW